MSLSRFVAAVLFAVFTAVVLTCIAGVVTYGVSLELGYPPVEGKAYTALLGAFVSATLTLAAWALACGIWAARERKGQARVFMPRDTIVVVAVAAPLFVLWVPIAAVLGLVVTIAFYGLGLIIGGRRAQTQVAEA